MRGAISLIDKRKINRREPIETSDFTELFHFVWKHGIGNHLTNDIPNPWTAETLEAAFDKLGISIDKRSIQNWHSGITSSSTIS